MATSASGLFWLIILSLFLPWLAVALEFGKSKVLFVNLMISLVIPTIIVGATVYQVISESGGEILSPEKFAGSVPFAIANLLGTCGFIHAVYYLCVSRYRSESNEEGAELPEYESNGYTPVDTGKSQSA